MILFYLSPKSSRTSVGNEIFEYLTLIVLVYYRGEPVPKEQPSEQI